MEFTTDQRKAVYIHDRNLVVIAGAGSGKTRVLVSRYLALLEANPDWPLTALVAITFTRKAAQEMRDRVRAALDERRLLAEHPERWETLLAQMDSARIDTIHGLCAALLRANAAEANLPPDFAVLDETESRLLLQDTVEQVLNTIARNPDSPALDVLSEYSARQLQDVLTDSALIASDLPPVPDDHYQAALNHWREQVESLGLPSLLAELYAIVPDPASWPPDDKMTAQLELLYPHIETITPAVVQNLRQIKKNVGTQKNWSHVDLKPIKSALGAVKDALNAAVLPEFSEDHERRAADLVAGWHDLISAVQTAYHDAKRRDNVLDFDDLERRTRHLLEAHPAVRDRYQQDFQHILVDEFQDTNVDQWAIVKALAPLDVPGRLFVVGDPKQSIYAFRGADVSVFGSVQAEITGRPTGDAVNLSRSFRTHAPLIRAFNTLFGAFLVRDPESPVTDYQVELGEAMTAERQDAPSPAPPLEIMVIGGTSGEDVETRRAAEGAAIARRIYQLVEQEKRVIYDREQKTYRPVTYGDIGVLYRSGSSLVIYEDALKRAEIPYITVGGRGYYQQQEIWDVMSLLEAITNPENDLALAVALRSPLFGLSDDALFVLRRLRDEGDQPLTLWTALARLDAPLPPDEIERVAFARDTLAQLHGQAGRRTVAALLRLALNLTGYLATISALPGGDQRRANVEKLLEKAQASGTVSLGAFTRSIAVLDAGMVREGEASVATEGVVNLMTVHASKGLEFPVVFLIDTSRTGRGGTSLLKVDPAIGLGCRVYDPDQGKEVGNFIYDYIKKLDKEKDEAESLRLLYVAMTRAQDLLIISGQSALKDGGFYRLSGWLKQLLDYYDQYNNGFVASHDQTVGPLRVHHHAVELLPASGGKPMPEFVPVDPDEDPELPFLMKPVTVDRTFQARHLATTHIADLGGASENAVYGERFRRRVLHDAPAYVRRLAVDQPHGVRPSQVGEIVHTALRYWHLPGDYEPAHYHAILAAYAWDYGVTESFANDYAVRQAADLLMKFETSDLRTEIEQAQAKYHELPFIYAYDGFVIHGVIDILFRDAEGQWHIVDYKTSAVRPGRLRQHARRYHLQLGIYAQAVSTQLGMIPKTSVHYIRHGRTVHVAQGDWRQMLRTSLKIRIQEVIEDRHDQTDHR
jgi:ATP-dependent helicase/nuclease subunit A